MAQFTSAERINAAFKQVFRILGSSNTDDAMGKRWYEELYSSVGTILPRHQWSQADEITFCSSLAQAQTLAFTKPAIVEDRSQVGTVITLTLDATSNGRLWIARDTPGDENSAILGDWIQPNDFPNAAGQPSNGFSCVLLDGANNVITATEGAWVPFYPLGCIVLANGQGVGQGELAAYVAPLKVAVFRYVGLKGGAAPVAPSAASFVRDEDPVIHVDGQVDFDLDWSAAPDSLEVSLNGILRTAGVDYTLVGRHVTWLDPFNPDLGVNVPLKTTDWLNFWYVNGATRRGITHHVPLPVLAPGQMVFTLPTAPLQNQHIQLYLNGQRCRQGPGEWYTVTGTTVVWLNPVVFFAPLGLMLLPTDVLTAAYIETADQGESTVKRPILPVTADGQTLFTVPAPDDPDSAKLYVNGQFQTLGVDWQWNTPTQIQWLDPFNPSTGLPITLVTTDEVQFIADNVGARCCGAQKFYELEDVPPDYVSQAGRLLTVNATEDGIEYVAPPAPYDEFTKLIDVPGSYTGEARKLVAVKGDETGLEFIPAVNLKVRAVIDPTPGGGDYTTIAAALLAGVDKMELRSGKVFAESVVIARGDVDILGYPDSIVVPPPGSTHGFLLDGSAGSLERLRFVGFMVQMNHTHPNNFSAFRSTSGDLDNIKFKDLILFGYHYHPAMNIDVSCGIDFANVAAPIEDVEVAGVLFRDWEYSCFTMWGAGITDVRVHACRLLNYHTFGMDWYSGCSEIMINNNNFRTSYIATPVIIVDGQTKGLFINGNANHITFNNNTFIGGGVGGGRAVMISPHAGTPYSVVVSSNVMRAFLCAIWAGGDRHIITGNENSEVWAGGENADGWQDAGNTNLIIANNHANV